MVSPVTRADDALPPVVAGDVVAAVQLEPLFVDCCSEYPVIGPAGGIQYTLAEALPAVAVGFVGGSGGQLSVDGTTEFSKNNFLNPCSQPLLHAITH